MRYLLTLFLITIFSLSAEAQRILTLDEALDIALKESYMIKTADLQLESSEKTLEAIKLGLMTNVSMEFDMPRYQFALESQFNPITVQEEFYEIGHTTVEGRLLFTQPIAFTNGTFSLVGSLLGRDQFGTDRETTRDYYSNLSLRLQQPLFTFNTLGARLERAEINLKKSERNYTKAEHDIIYRVTSSFYRLFQSKKQVEIAREKVEQNEAAYNTAENKYKAGLIAEVEAMQLEVDLASSRNELLDKEKSYRDALNNFKLLLGLPLDEEIDLSGSLDYEPIVVDGDAALLYALKNRPELLNAKSDIQLRELDVDEVDSRGNINAMLSANYGINKNDEELDLVFRNFAEDRRVTFTVSIPVWDWGQNNRMTESAEANLRQAQLDYRNNKEEVRNEITSLVNEIESAKARVEVLSKSVELARKSYNISVERFNAGTITAFDLQQMQIRLTDAQLNSLGALIDYKIAVADLKRKTLHDFEKD